MNAKHIPHKRDKRKLPRMFRSWWIAVALLLCAMIGLAAYQWNANHKPGFNERLSDAKQEHGTQGYVAYGVVIGAGHDKSSSEARAHTLNRLKHAGFNHVRLSLNWQNVEPEKGTYNWTYVDKMMKTVKKTGLKPILLANTTPGWARINACKTSLSCPPENPDDYAKFLAAAAERYKDYDVAAWEIWNEQNGSNFWKPLPDASQYAQLLKVTYTAIKKADPNATVLIGGLSGDSNDSVGASMIDPRSYLTKLYAAGVHGYFDGLAYHPYVAGLGPLTKSADNNGWIKMSTTASNIRNIMSKNGDADKGVWITEFGVPTGGSGSEVTDLQNIPPKADHVSVEVQAQLAKDAVQYVQKNKWVKSFIWYTDIDNTSAATNTGAAYGIWQNNGQPKPVLKVLQQGINSEV